MFFRPRFLLLSSSPTASLTPPAAPLTPLSGIRLNPCATLLWVDCLAIWPIRSQTQVMSPSSASMSVASMSFQQEYDATITASEDLNLPRHSGASSSSQHTPASRATTLPQRSSSGTSLTKVSAGHDSGASRTSVKEDLCGHGS